MAEGSRPNEVDTVPNFSSTTAILDKMEEKSKIRQLRSGVPSRVPQSKEDEREARGYLDHLVRKSNKTSGEESSTS